MLYYFHQSTVNKSLKNFNFNEEKNLVVNFYLNNLYMKFNLQQVFLIASERKSTTRFNVTVTEKITFHIQYRMAQLIVFKSITKIYYYQTFGEGISCKI